MRTVYNGVDLSDSKPSQLTARLHQISHLKNGDISASDDLISYIRVDAEDAADRIEKLERQHAGQSETIEKQNAEIEELRAAIGSVELVGGTVGKLATLEPHEWTLPVRVDVQLYVGDKKVSLASLTGGP